MNILWETLSFNTLSIEVIAVNMDIDAIHEFYFHEFINLSMDLNSYLKYKTISLFKNMFFFFYIGL